MTTPTVTTPRHPAIELLGRYKAILQAAWQARHELAGPKRLADEAAFLPAALSLQETPVHPAPRRAAIAICALFTIALIWSIVGEVDIVAVAHGRIVVSERTKVIQPLETSVVKRILVKDGDEVKEGQVLVELDATAAKADQSSVQEQLDSAKEEAERSEALLKALNTNSNPQGASPLLYAEWADISSKRAKLDAELARRQAEIQTVQASIEKLHATLPIVKQREADFKALADQGFVAGHANQDRTRERIELERDLAMQQARLQETKAALNESQQAKLAYLAEIKRTLSDRLVQARLKQSQFTNESAKTLQRTELTQLRAPVSGTVQQVAIHTPGGVVTEAQPLMVIVPHDAQVTAEVTIDNKDIGFVHPGQKAEIKLETFPFTKYGTVPAEVTWVTADAVNDEKRGAVFPAMIKLQYAKINVNEKQIPLAPGMNVTAEIIMSKRKIIDFMAEPSLKLIKESFKER